MEATFVDGRAAELAREVVNSPEQSVPPDAIPSSIDAFFSPRSVAVVGASDDPTKGGNRILANLLKHFPGAVYAVNPNHSEVMGIPSYPDLAAVPSPVDLAVVFIPAEHVPKVVSQCIEYGVKAVCVESGGFADAGDDGRALQADLAELAAGSSIRIWGPNCAGYVSSDPAFSTSFVVMPDRIPPGSVSLVAQSGMMAGALFDQILSQEVLGISKACSIGNKVDVDESDLVEYLVSDPSTEVVALYLESVADGARFTAALDAITPRSAVVALMGGTSEPGARAALSHTGSVAGDESVVSGVLGQHGVLQVADFMELIDVAAALAILESPRRAGKRVAVLTFSGAAGVVAADLFQGRGLALARLSETSLVALSEIFPPWLAPTNPVDVWSTVELRGLGETVSRSLDILSGDEGVDAILLIGLAFQFFSDDDLASVGSALKRAGVPVVSWTFGHDSALRRWRNTLESAGTPLCRSLDLSVKVLHALSLRDASLHRLSSLTGTQPQPVPNLLAGVEGPVIGEREAKQILSGFGVPSVAEEVARGPDDAMAAADRLGYPVALKLDAEALAHRTRIDGIRLGLADGPAVRDASKRLLEIASHRRLANPRLIVQPMVAGGLEILIGARHHPSFGAVLVVGPGGTQVESIRRVAVRKLPVTTEDVEAMFEEAGLRALAADAGVSPDWTALTSAVKGFARFMSVAGPEAIEAEVNPFLALPEGGIAVDALIVKGGTKP